jgi:predicted ATPase
MISAIEIENFQGFAGHHAIRLAPITLVLGANATGKSTVGRVLKLVAQSPRGILEFSGKNTDLVSFEKAIFGQLLEASQPDELSISVTVPLRAEHFAASSSSGGDEEEDFEDTHWETYLEKFQELFSTRQIKYLADCVQTSMYFGQKRLSGGPQESSNTLMTGFEYVEPRTGERLKCGFGWTGDERFLSKDDSEQIVLMAEPAGDEQQAIKKFSQTMQTILVKAMDVESHTSAWTEGYSETQNAQWLVLLTQLPKAVVSRGIAMSTLAVPQDDSPESVNWTFLGGLLEAAAQARRTALESIYEVSGVRDFELRATRLTEPEGFLVTPASQFRDEALRQASQALMQLTNGRYSVHKENVRTSTPTKSINTEETFVVDNLTNARVSFSNVGAGLGQLLPILEGLFSFPRGKTLLIEQPELHLHPKAQADLATLFVDAVEEGNVEQVILETHSEAMLLRIQRLVREGRLKSTDVAIVVTQEAPISENEPNASRGNMIYNIELAADGDLKEPMLLSFAGVRLDEFL